MSAPERASPNGDPPIVSAGLEKVLQWLAAGTLLALMMLTVVDVAARYVFNRPIPGAYQLVMAIMGMLVFVGLPMVTLRGEHLQAGLFDHLLTGRVGRMRTPLILAGSFVALAGLAWRLGTQAMRYQISGASLASVGIPMAGLTWIGAVSCALSAVLVVWVAVASRRHPVDQRV